MAQGNIGVTSTNIFPVIKKFLYSDHEIFLRELVSNAVDATQKLKTLASVGEFKGELGDTKVRISLDKQKRTLTVTDRGIGMTADEVNKYINEIAFSGAEEFVNKYKDNAAAIIGHFGLGFYSAFMVADKVEIFSQSWREEEKAVHWSCDGSPVYDMEDTIKADRGTDIVLHLGADFDEYLEDSKIEGLLKKYCRFLPVEIAFGKKKEWKDGKQVELEEDNVVNYVNPAWTRKPQDLKEEDYADFYHQLYPDQMEEPLFHIHLNVDYPFHLTGILYFPKIQNNLDIHRNKIQLYCNQVFVTDEVENIVPQYLTLLHGVIDSPDIPLNVSRSYLQSDQNVKKISSHITKKVADKLFELYRDNKEDFQNKWEDIKLFIQFGMLSDEKFYERATKFALVKNVSGEYATMDEYLEKIRANQTDKDGNLVALYTQDPDANYTHIERAKQMGYDVLKMEGELDVHYISQAEQKYVAPESDEKKGMLRFARVDSDLLENLIRKADAPKMELSEEQQEGLRKAFEAQLPSDQKLNYYVSFEAAAADALPVFLVQNEFMRRMREMSAHQQGMSFYGNMPEQYNLVINTNHPLIQSLTEAMTQETVLETPEQKEGEEPKAAVEKTVYTLAGKDDRLAELVDIAFLASGKLKGEALSKFVNRSLELLK
ncbi:MAG: molecular chaperone HtpG [Bacteroidales bacterium]|nr:molecular chaperone HtpG [Candidatus Colicola faecequi]